MYFVIPENLSVLLNCSSMCSEIYCWSIFSASLKEGCSVPSISTCHSSVTGERLRGQNIVRAFVSMCVHACMHACMCVSLCVMLFLDIHNSNVRRGKAKPWFGLLA